MNRALKQHNAYEKSLLQYWEMTSAIDTEYDEGWEEGRLTENQQRLREAEHSLLHNESNCSSASGL